MRGWRVESCDGKTQVSCDELKWWVGAITGQSLTEALLGVAILKICDAGIGGVRWNDAGKISGEARWMKGSKG